jgi:hypothetical protein
MYWVGGWVGNTVDLDFVTGKEESVTLSKDRTPAVQYVASLCTETDVAVPSV